ncbi:MAG: hypothetical protein IKH43_07010 [Bacteroidaceae bacterium]|nr:hypothetical protein [Bacteroidaceae bacterium]
MKKQVLFAILLFMPVLALALFSFVSCVTSAKEEIPEHSIVDIDAPNVSANGSISPSENLEYKIEIPRPLQQDSLKLLQDYFIKKGKSDYPSINKIIVRVFVKGSSLTALPYASLILIDNKKEILITGGSKNSDFIKNRLTDYEILGCWVIYQEDCYILCQKDGEFYEVNVNKEKQKISELKPIATKIIQGTTAYYIPDDPHHAYMIIKDDGLYIYDDSGDNAVVWANDPTWNK